MFFLKSLKLAVDAIPHLFISKWFYEMKWGFYTGLIAIFSMMAMFSIPPLLILLPLSLSVAQSAMTLGTLHSMLGFMGHTKGYNTEFLVSEIIKTSFVRAIGYTAIFVILGLVMLASFSLDYLTLLFKKPDAFMQLETTRLQTGTLPALLVAAFIFTALTLLMEAVLAVPMAAAAYAIGPSDRSFNGFWGIGFYWKKVLSTWLLFGGLIVVLGGISLDLLTEEFQIRSVIHLIGCYLTGSAPDLATYPLAMPLFDSKPAAFVGVILLFFACYVPTPLWAATCALAFKEMLVVDEQNRIGNLPTPAEIETANQKKMRAAKKHWQTNMPSRWGDRFAKKPDPAKLFHQHK